MSAPQYLFPGFDFALAHAVEEAGEFLAAAGKLQRFGRSSVNPELPADQQETNEDWLLREAADLVGALRRLTASLDQEQLEAGSRSQGLEIAIAEGRLVISIGVDALMVAVKGSPVWEEQEADERSWTIDNVDGFAADIVQQLDAEEEDGTTLVHVAFDNAIERAIDAGSLNIGYGRDG